MLCFNKPTPLNKRDIDYFNYHYSNQMYIIHNRSLIVAFETS